MSHGHDHSTHEHKSCGHAAAAIGAGGDDKTKIDPVCGMKVDPHNAKHRTEHLGRPYYFCSAGCRTKFVADPDKYLSPKKKAEAPLPAGTIYTCPMHPQIRQIGPGSCPICGMALEPELVSADTGPNPELADMTRRFWIGLVLTLPVFALEMGSHLVGGHGFLPQATSNLIQFALATPVVLWAGWPFFERGWQSLVTRNLNMFTLIALGTGVAWLYSVVATFFPALFPTAFRGHDGAVAVYFESAAVITVLVLLGQVLELRAREATSGAIKALLGLAPKTTRRVKADGSTVQVASAATQADGTYQVAGLFPGPYVLRFEAPGFRTTYYPTATSEADAKKLAATTGSVNTSGDAVVIGLPATISGKVDFGDITEPQTATVSARLLGAGAGGPTVIPDVKTSADGSYKFANLPAPGTYTLTFVADGYETSTMQTTVTGGANRFVSASVLSAGAAQISGTVTDGTSPLGGATVSITVNGQQQSTGTPTVGQVGHFVIGNLPTPATYILTVSKDGYGQVSQVIDLGPSGQQGDLTIVLTAGTGVVTGTVTAADGSPVGGATVTAGGLADPPQTTTLTDGPVGTFRLEGLPVPGSYTITVSAPGFADQTVPVALAADAVLPPIGVTLTPAMGSITGQVLGADGKGVVSAAVSVTDGQKVWPVVTTSASGGTPAGSFTVAGLPSGRYTVTATVVDASGTATSQTRLAAVAPGPPVSLSFPMGG